MPQSVVVVAHRLLVARGHHLFRARAKSIRLVSPLQFEKFARQQWCLSSCRIGQHLLLHHLDHYLAAVSLTFLAKAEEAVQATLRYQVDQASRAATVVVKVVQQQMSPNPARTQTLLLSRKFLKPKR